jgi:hypothetical protein
MYIGIFEKRFLFFHKSSLISISLMSMSKQMKLQYMIVNINDYNILMIVIHNKLQLNKLN